MQTRETLYNTYLDAQSHNLEKTALYTRDGETVTHGRLFEEIDKTAAWLTQHKNTEVFKVGIISSSSYEEAVFLLAASKIGAVAKFIDFTKNITEIGESVKESAISVLAIGAEFLPMEPFINPNSLPVIVLGETSSTAPHFCTYNSLIKNANGCSVSPVSYRDNTCAVIINSSGTTGTPKPIELSDQAINAAVKKMAETDYPLSGNNLMLKTIPSHIGMGLITSLYTCLILGVPMIYLGGNSPKESIELTIGLLLGYRSFLDQHKLDNNTKLLIFGAPMYYRSIFQLIDHLTDLSFIGCMLAGGSAMSKEELEIMDAAFAERGCTVPILNGYGQNEMAGAVTLNQNGKNRRGSAGMAVSETRIRIVDIVTGDELGKNKTGKIIECSDSLFLQYENMEEATNAAFIDDKNQTRWFDTNDLGYLDDDGYLFITGRTSRIIIRFDCKISLDTIENKIRMSQYIKETGVISVKDNMYESIVAFVLLKDEFANNEITQETIITDIQQSRNPLNELENVDKIIFVNTLPYRSSGKIDYIALEKQAEEMK